MWTKLWYLRFRYPKRFLATCIILDIVFWGTLTTGGVLLWELLK